MTHPGAELPVALAASMHALACLLSYDGMSNMGIARKLSKDSPNYVGDDNFLLSLLSSAQVQHIHGRNSPLAYYNGPSIVPPFALASPRRFINSYVNPASSVKPSPSVSAAIPVEPSKELVLQGESILQNPSTCKSKKNKKKKKNKQVIVVISSGEPKDPAPTPKPSADPTPKPSLARPTPKPKPSLARPTTTPKPSLAGYGATTYGPYGPRADVDIQRGSVGVKRRRGAL